MTTPHILFLGDCNTRGTPDIEGQAYPEQLAQLGDYRVQNCGHTMATIREGSAYFERHLAPDVALVCIQYGLVDAWRTVRFAPYVPYYPDSGPRKLARKLVKKYKKLCHRLRLDQTLGSQNVVPIVEYRLRIEAMIQAAAPRPVVLIETIPNHDLSRNQDIQRYNQCLHAIAESHATAHVLPLYEEFSAYLDVPFDPHRNTTLYADPTHLSRRGHRLVAERLYALSRHIL